MTVMPSSSIHAAPSGARAASARPQRVHVALALLMAVGALVAGCAEFTRLPSPLEDVSVKRNPDGALDDPRVAEIEGMEMDEGDGLTEPEISPGSGRVIGALPRPGKPSPGPGEVMLNFEDTDIQEVVKVVLADLLEANYIMEPGVSGAVSIQSSRPLARDELLPVLESLLDINGAALTYDEKTGLYRVAPRTNAVRSAFPPSVRTILTNKRPGFSTEIAPLSFIAVEEMKQILTSFVGEDSIIYADERRNLLVLAGTPQLLDQINDTIALFDVDWMAGMSTGLFPLKYAEAETIISELESILIGESGPEGKALIRFTPIERLNAVLVITPQPVYLERAKDWISTLDRGSGGEGRRLFVYRVKNGLATDLANVLSNMFGDQAAGGRSGTPSARVAPGLQQARTASTDTGTGQGTGAGSRVTGGGAGSGSTSFDAGSIRIIADEINNALVIMATSLEYQMIEQALRELDVMPLQVLIEASIIEIRLTDELSYGLEWAFENGGIDIGSANGQTGAALLDLGDPGLASLTPGFSYALLDSTGAVQAVLNTLASRSQVNVLSSPTVMVLGNQTATINVGDQVPIASRQSVSNIDPAAPTVNEIEYRDTGVILTVTPRVNPGGLITMEIQQEVSDVAVTTSSGIDAPTIQQRNIESTVAIQSGNTIILGGLIRDNASDSDSGFPGLHEIPVIGTLFGNTSRNNTRTELIVLITPRAVTNTRQAIEVTDEFQTRLKGLAPRSGGLFDFGSDGGQPAATPAE